MAYLNQEKLHHSCFVDPRISFSNDFVEPKRITERKKYKEAPVSSSEFDFGVKHNGMIPADEIFFEGVLVPWKCERRMTLREKLYADGGEEEENGLDRSVMVKVKSSSWWRERLGLKSKQQHKCQVGIGSKKREELSCAYSGT